MQHSTHVYILTDGTNSKIGISNNIESRLQAYRTHNPNFKVHRVKNELSVDVARRIEAIVKACFKHAPSTTGKEWFKVTAENMASVVDFHLATDREACFNGVEPNDIAAGAVPLTTPAKDLLTELSSTDGAKRRDLEIRFADLFASSFNLGISQYRLPETVVIRDDGLPVDINYCDFSAADPLNFDCNRIVMPNGIKHLRHFYRLVELKSGNHVALCTGTVSMPYFGALADVSMSGLRDLARSCGVNVFQHDEWSWHSEQTNLILFTQRTGVQDRAKAFDNSFRKWIIENARALIVDTGFEKEIGDISNDSSFPLHVTSWTELYICYLKRITHNRSQMRLWRENYTRLFKMWNRT